VICVVLLLLPNYHLLKLNSSVIFGGGTQIPMIGHLLAIIRIVGKIGVAGIAK
jgi:hypothetical protein